MGSKNDNKKCVVQEKDFQASLTLLIPSPTHYSPILATAGADLLLVVDQDRERGEEVFCLHATPPLISGSGRNTILFGGEGGRSVHLNRI